MRRRILGAILASTAVALVGFGAPLAIAIQSRYRDEALLRISAAAATAAVNVPGSYARQNDQPELPDPTPNIDIALYDRNGRRLLGSGPDHADDTVNRTLRSGKVHQDRDGLVVAFPIADEERVVGTIRASMPNEVVAARTRRTWLAMGALAVAVFTATTGLALRRSRSLARPLAQLRDDATIIGEGGEIPARPAQAIVEIDDVHRALVDAAGRLNELLSRERAFSADLAHQLRTPIASLRLRLETEQLDPDADQQLLTDSLRDVDRLETTIDDLVSLARDITAPRTPRPLATLVIDQLDRWRDALTEQRRELHVSLEPELPYVTTRPQAVHQILDVLLANAVRHGAGAVTVTGTRLGNGAVIAVADEGTLVVDPAKIFERRGSVATGTGIGLALARRLAEAEDLRLFLARPGPGAAFHLVFGGTPAAGHRRR